MQNISIALAQAEHLARIPAIELAGASLFSERDLPQRVRHRVTDQANLQQAMNDEQLWTAVADRRPVGFAMADVVDGQGYLTEVDVLPDYGRRGIGTALVRTVLDWARGRHFESLSLITFRHLPWNAPFYAKLGFCILDPAELGPEFTGLMAEEAAIGVDIRRRVGMRIRL